jgi:hypothetical protein
MLVGAPNTSYTMSAAISLRNCTDVVRHHGALRNAGARIPTGVRANIAPLSDSALEARRVVSPQQREEPSQSPGPRGPPWNRQTPSPLSEPPSLR